MSSALKAVVTASRPSPVSGAAAKPAAKPERVVSLDALRGFDMFWIVGGQGVVQAIASLVAAMLPIAWLEALGSIDWKYQMDHVRWEEGYVLHGFSAWDLIMPLFLFVVGAAMPFAFGKYLEQGKGKLFLYGRIIRRVLALWILGMIAQGNLLDFNVWLPRVLQPQGVDNFHLHLFSNTLQAIAVGYLFASIIVLHLPKIAQIVTALVLLVAYWAILKFVPAPGQEAGVLLPKQNLALFIDEAILGRFRDGLTYTWILGGIGFTVTVLLGVFAGHLLRTEQSGLKKFLWLTLAGLGCLTAGLAWHGQFHVASWEVDLDGVWRCPMNKHLWTSSMVLYAAGWSYLLLAAFYLVMDVMKLRWLGFFFTVIGANAIFAYMAKGIIPFDQIANRLFGGLAKYVGTLGDPWPLISQAILPVASFGVLWLVLFYMYRKGTFLRV